MTELATHLIAFLIGTVTGAAGAYFGEKYTDKRRKKESESADDILFKKVAAKMPDLLKEMKNDLEPAEHQVWRNFFVIPKGAALWASEHSFVYEDDGSHAYLTKVRILEEHGYVVDITPGNAPMFRMKEHFVDRLQKWKE